MTGDYPAVAAPEDEDQDQRARLYNEMYPPVSAPTVDASNAALPALVASAPLPTPSATGYVAPTPASAEKRGTDRFSAYPAPAPASASAPDAAPAPYLAGGPIPGAAPAEPPAPRTATMGDIPKIAVPQEPRWKDYAPAERHGWGKVGSILATVNPIANEIVNRRPLENAERNYKFATAEYEAPFRTGEEAARAEHESATADAERTGSNKSPDTQAYNSRVKAGETPAQALQETEADKRTGVPPTAEQDRRTVGELLYKQQQGTITQQEQTQLNQLGHIYPHFMPVGEGGAGQYNARISDMLAQNPTTKKKVQGGAVPDEYRVLPTDTGEVAKEKEARAAGLGSAAQRQIGINVNAGEHNIETVLAKTPAGNVYESKEAAEAAGHQILNKSTPQEEQKARQAYTQYGRMIDNAQDAMMTMPVWRDGSKDKNLAMRVSKQFFSSIPMTGIDPAYVDQFLNSDDYKQMSQDGQKHMQNMFQIWSDAINVVKQETGGVPRGQMFLQKEDAILPHPEKTYEMNVQALNSFVKRMKKDSSEYGRPSDMPDLQAGVAPPDAKGYIRNADGQRIGYIDAKGKRVNF